MNSTSRTNKKQPKVPPSHPQEQHAEHRAFLMRSLDRNDCELAALLELNRSLYAIKNALDELFLLDLGRRKWKALQDTNLSEQQRDLATSFLLRMQLRRKLLNRVVRRTNRLAHAMDGNDVNPPHPPRYGDLRLHVDETQVEAFELLCATQEQAKRLMQAERAMYKFDVIPNTTNRMDTKEEEEASKAVVAAATVNKQPLPPFVSNARKIDYAALQSYDDAYETTTATGDSGATRSYTKLLQLNDNLHGADWMLMGSATGIGAVQRSMNAKEKETDYKQWQASVLGRIPEQPTFKELGMEQRVFLWQERKKRAMEKKEQNAAGKQGDESTEEMNASGSGKPLGKTLKTGVDRDSKDTTENMDVYDDVIATDADIMDEAKDDNDHGTHEDAEAIKDLAKANVDAADLPLHSATGTATDENKSVVKSSDMNMSKDISTIETKDGGSGKQSSPLTKENDNDDETLQGEVGDIRVKNEESDEALNLSSVKEEHESEKVTDTVSRSPGKAMKSKSVLKDDDNDELGDSVERNIRKTRLISLAHVPSFYEQDLKRIRQIHGELISASMSGHNRSRLEEVVKNYNRTLRESQELAGRKEKVDERLRQIIYEKQQKLGSIAYATHLATAQREWHQKRRFFENDKLDKMLNSRWNNRVIGTAMTQRYQQRNDQVAQEVAKCLADVVDSVELVVEGKLANPKFTVPFVPPQKSTVGDQIVDQATGETYQQRADRVEQSLQKESKVLAQRYLNCEEDRRDAWQTMLKVKADADMTQDVIQNNARRRLQLTASNYHSIALPSLRESTVEQLPRSYGTGFSNLAAYTPPAQASMPVDDALYRYSAGHIFELLSSGAADAPVSMQE